MSATVLLHGRLHRDPQAKTSGKGNAFAMATVRVGQGDDAQWWRVFAFATEPRDELLTLHDGDGVAVSGAFKAEIYTGAGEPRVSFSVTAERCISAKRQKREQKPKAKPQEKPQPASRSDVGGRPFDDEVPF